MLVGAQQRAGHVLPCNLKATLPARDFLLTNNSLSAGRGCCAGDSSSSLINFDEHLLLLRLSSHL